MLFSDNHCFTDLKLVVFLQVSPAFLALSKPFFESSKTKISFFLKPESFIHF